VTQIASTSPPATPVDDNGVVVADVPCRRCSYNVRSLNVSARCPECGAPVGVSVHGPLLRYSDPGWLRNLGTGASFIFWGILGGVVLGVATGPLTAVGPYVGQVVGMIGGVVQLYGAWLLTAPDPGGIGEDQYGTARKVIRVCLVAGALANVIQLMNGPTPRAASLAGMTPLQIALTLGAAGAGLAGLVGQFVILRYVEKLTLRVPDPALSRRARRLFRGYGGAIAAMVLVVGVAVPVGLYAARPAAPGPGTGGLNPSSVAMGAAAAGGIAVAALLVVVEILYLFLLRRLRHVFAEQARLAAEAWGSRELAAG
jgi:hypothetical protein